MPKRENKVFSQCRKCILFPLRLGHCERISSLCGRTAKKERARATTATQTEREREKEREEDASREHEMQHKDICEEEDICTQFIREEKHVLLKRKKHPRKQEGI